MPFRRKWLYVLLLEYLTFAYVLRIMLIKLIC